MNTEYLFSEIQQKALIGSAVVQSRPGNHPVDIKIQKIKNLSNRLTIFNALLPEQNKYICIGKVTFSIQIKNEHSTTQNAVYEKMNKIYIERLISYHRTSFKGIGTALMQSVIEYSFHKNFEGRLFLEAIQSSHLFYYKLGMRSPDPEINRRILDHEMDYHPVPCVMSFPSDALLIWKERILSQNLTGYGNHELLL